MEMREAALAGGAAREMIDLIVEVRVPRLLSIATVAEIVGRSPKTVRRRIDDGSLPAVVEHGQLMVRGDDLRAYIDGLQSPRRERSRRRRQGAEPYARLAA
jgi:Helix-turn-helix domain